VLPSIQKHILTPNSNCDVYIHTYNVTSAFSDAQDLRLLSRDFVIDMVDVFNETMNLSYYRQFFPHNVNDSVWTTGGYPTFDNLMKQWYSISRVWGLMAAAEAQDSRRYDRVGLFRSDLLYLDDVNIWDGDPSKAVIPPWNMGDSYWNDRMLIASRPVAERWSAWRFPYVERYVATSYGKYWGLHAERFLYHLMRHGGYPVDVDFRNICAVRVRASGDIFCNDCSMFLVSSDTGPSWTGSGISPASRQQLPSNRQINRAKPAYCFDIRAPERKLCENICLNPIKHRQWDLIHIPKTGGTSIEEWGLANGYLWGRNKYLMRSPMVDLILGQQQPLMPVKLRNDSICKLDDEIYISQGWNTSRCCSPWHLPASYGGPSVKQPGVSTFCVIRDPVDRALSQLHWVAARKGYYGPRATLSDFNIDLILQSLDAEPLKQDCHWVPQREYLQHCDHILRFEHLQEDFCTFVHKQLEPSHNGSIATECHLPVTQESLRGDFDEQIASRATIDKIVRKAYAEDYASLFRHTRRLNDEDSKAKNLLFASSKPPV